MATNKSLLFLFFVFHLALFHRDSVEGHPNYNDALAKSVLFFQGQRSGKLPPDQKMTWRSHSGLSDGSAANVKMQTLFTEIFVTSEFIDSLGK
jgi:endoglucanase